MLLLLRPCLEQRPLDAVETTDAERRELLERGGRKVEAADRTAGAGVDDGDDDRLLAPRHAQLAAAHGVPVAETASASCLRQRMDEGSHEATGPPDGDGEQGYVLVGVRTGTGEAGDRGVVDGDDHVPLRVGAPARADTGGVERSCADGDVSMDAAADDDEK